jgi:inhibitor of cysteine peptidase
MGPRLILAVAVLALAACGDDDDSGSAEQTFTEANSGEEVQVDPGDRFEVQLESNPTTGYSWVLDEESTGGVVSLEDDEFVEPDSDLVGAPGTQVFTFEAVESGTTTLRLEYVRPFEDDPVAEQTMELVIEVGG